MMVYQHSKVVRFIAWLWFVIFGGCIVLCLIDPKGEGLWRFIPIFAGLVSLMVWLYLTEGLASWTISEDGLEIRNPVRSRLVKWSEIRGIKSSPALRLIKIQGERKTLSFVSMDYFPNFEEFVAQIEARISLIQHSPS
jgi:hypothetical protein